MNPHPFTVDESNFDPDVLGAGVPVLLEVTASYCGPCRALAPLLETLAGEAHGAYRVGVLDLEACPNLASALAVRAVPTLIVFRGGRETTRRTGLVGLDVLRKLVSAGGDEAAIRPRTLAAPERARPRPE
jgi:thioredoxin 1